MRVVVLTGEGPNFCAGGDVKDFASKGEGLPDYLREATAWLQIVASALIHLRCRSWRRCTASPPVAAGSAWCARPTS